MLAKAETKYVRISARKTRLVIDLVKGKTVEEANSILDNVNKKACVPIKKTIGSAFANANHDRQEKFLSKDVFISAIRADGGPMLQRYRAATMGRATPIRHRTAHIYVELDAVAAGKTKKEGSGSK
ncbi:MAG: 50S ribosomal protein L22 [Candidatus Omnitrophota bacterium]